MIKFLLILIIISWFKLNPLIEKGFIDETLVNISFLIYFVCFHWAILQWKL